jgi:TRAP-type mannitol/chloroaromatic compound transport system permease small subunit
MAGFLVIASWDYVSTSWAIREASREAGGLPFPFVPILKSLIPATAVMLVLQGIADSLGAILSLTGRAVPDDGKKVSMVDVI